MRKIDIRDRRSQIIAFAAVLFFGLNYLFFLTSYLPFFYMPKKTAIDEKKRRYEQLALRVEEARRATANLPRLEAELEELHARWEVAMSHLPEKKEIASLLRRVTLSGERAGVRFLLFEPQEVFSHGIYDEHPVRVRVEGGYHGVGSFLGNLVNLDRIVRVSGISMKSHRTDEEEQVVQGEMIVSAFAVPAVPASKGGIRPSPAGAPEPNRDEHPEADANDSNE
ncbi:MAG: type 4a pilus biogenesis protein PilO [Candidatus Eisenbacteria bacterium]